MSLNKSAKNALTINLGVRAGERVLILTDEGKRTIGKAFYEEAQKITDKADYLEMPITAGHGQEPSAEIAEKMLNYDVIVIVTTKSLSHTNARKAATEKGTRIASMPTITEEIMERTISADYNIIKEETNRLCDVLDDADEVRITTEKGTDLYMSIKGLKCDGRCAGIFEKKGEWGNLPAGEANMAPVEGSTQGVFVVDATMAGIGKIEEPITVKVEKGFATEITGGKEADALRGILEEFNDKRVYNIAELGIGTNYKAIITGNTLEDEKVKGTCHIALGNNTSYDGGKTKAPVHLDGVMLKPTIIVDGKTIMEKGKLLI